MMLATASLVAMAQTVKTVGATGADYATLKAAFDAINAGSLTSPVELQIIDNTTETAAAVLSNTGVAVTIYPTVTGKSISGSVAGNLIQLGLEKNNVVSNVIIDGRLRNSSGVITGLTPDLTIENTDNGTSTSTILFNNGSNGYVKDSKVTYCIIKGSSQRAEGSGGMIHINGGHADQTNIEFSFNKITASGGVRPINAVWVGANLVGAKDVKVINNDFENVVKTNGIRLNNRVINSEISGNNFYETANFTPTTAYNFIQLGGNVQPGYENVLISDNFLGGSEPMCGGSSLSTTGGDINQNFYGIYINGSTTQGVIIRGNQIKNINWTSTGSTTSATFYGIYFKSQSSKDVVDNAVNSIEGNFIGNIVFKSSAKDYNLYGISHEGYHNLSISNNIVNLGNSDANQQIFGIRVSSTYFDAELTGQTKVYYNTVYISGNQITANKKSYALYSHTNLVTRDFRNNIFANVRTGNDSHYSAFLNYSLMVPSPNTNNYTFSCDYNDYYTTKVAFLGNAGGDKSTLALFQTATGQDANSTGATPGITPDVTPESFKGTVALAGATGTGITTDFAGTTRTTPQIGAFFIPTATPTITGTATATAFTTTYGTASAKQDFSVSSSDLSVDITATAPTGFEVASDGATFGATATITKNTSGTLSLRLKANAAVGGSYNGVTVSLASTGATTKYITTAASGNTVTAAPITITGIGIANKEYDGSTTATITGSAAYSGLVNSESFTVTGTPAAAFADASVGNAKSITVSGYTAPSGNYSITQPTGLTANITAIASPINASGNLGNAATLPGTNITVATGVTLTVDQAGTTTVNSITVAPGGKLSLGTNSLVATNGITLQSNENGTATLTGDNAVTNATVQQYVTAGRNWYISPSVTAAPYNALNRGKGGLDGIVEYNEIEGRWDNVTSGTLVKGKGYIQVASASAPGSTGVVQFEGTTNTGNVSVTLSRTADKGKGFNLVGNPYPSYLDWTMAATANPNVLPTAWFRTQKTAGAGGGYGFATVNAENPATPEIVSNNANTDITKYIPPMQAYWVRLIESPLTTTYTVTNAMRAHIDAAGNSTGNTFKAPKASERSRLRLQLVNGIESDEALIYFDQAALNSFDRYDSPKMMNNSTLMPDIYSMSGAEKVVINGLNSVTDNLELPLGFTLKAAATGLKLKVSELSNFSADTKVYLHDKVLNTQTELTANSEYSFDITEAATNNESRFSLLFRAPNASTALNNTEKLNAQVFVNAANQITIVAPEKANYAIYNAVGVLLENGQTTAKLQTVNSKLQTGIYVVKVGTESKRVIIK